MIEIYNHQCGYIQILVCKTTKSKFKQTEKIYHDQINTMHLKENIVLSKASDIQWQRTHLPCI